MYKTHEHYVYEFFCNKKKTLSSLFTLVSSGNNFLRMFLCMFQMFHLE